MTVKKILCLALGLILALGTLALAESDDLQASLRSGDLFAPYSGCQYLLMVLGASSENAAVIAGRIHTRFMSRVAPDAGLLLRYDVYPMGELPLQPKG